MGDEYKLGIDIGGTFTDVTLVTPNQETVSLKTPTVQGNSTEGVKNGLELLKTNGVNLSEITYFVHGTTVGLNTLLQQKGEPIALFVTEGFRDILNLQRLRLPVPYDFNSRHPEPLIPRKYVYPINERLNYKGEVSKEIELESLDSAIHQAKDAGIKGIVVCLLHSYVNPQHEEFAEARIKELYPEMEVNVSSKLWPQMREYERSIMTAINLYIQSTVKEYFNTLRNGIKEMGVLTEPFITQSNGGIMNIDTAIQSPIKTLFSGPAAGVTGALEVAQSVNKSEIITFDMGGTSADISIIEDGKLSYTQDNLVSGYPVMMPAVSINSIGAGGGSYVWIDKGGLLKVGPKSVGSDPGPACYGKGDHIALTDAFLLCGYLNAENFASGEVEIFPEKSKERIQYFSDYLGLNAQKTADRIVQVAVANMDMEMSSVIDKHGFDPREFSLLAFGGAGPLMANYLAEEAQMDGVLIPSKPGTLSALGALTSDFIHDEIKTRQTLLDSLEISEMKKVFNGLETQATQWIDNQATTSIKESELFLSIDARYENQSYDINLPIERDWLDEQDNQTIIQAFHDIYLKIYGHNDPTAKIELINLQVRVIGYTEQGKYKQDLNREFENDPITNREIMIKGQLYNASVYAREKLTAYQKIVGPAIVEQDDSTILILPGWEGEVKETGDLFLQRS